MSKQQRTLRDLVQERLTAAAEEIFALFERTIVGYEEELSRCREENLTKQRCLDQVLNPSILLHKIPSPSPQAAQVKEETQGQSFREEPFPFPEVISACVKTEDPPKLQHHDINPETHIYSSVTEDHLQQTSDPDVPDAPAAPDDDDDLPAAHMETVEAAGDYTSHIHIRDMHTLAHTFYSGVSGLSAAVEKGTSPGTGKAPKDRRKYQCSACWKRFVRNVELQRHIRVHTGERPYCCSICKKSFTQKVHLEVHMRTHSSERPYSCAFCSKTFTQSVHLRVHFRTHTGERPYSCPVCNKTFTQKVYCQKHMLTHQQWTPQLH